MGTQLPSPKRGQRPPPQFTVHLYCGQTAGCIMVPLGMEVGLSLGNCVRWGPSLIPQKGRRRTQFSAHVYCGQAAAWIKMPLRTEVDLGLRDIVFDVDPATPRIKGTLTPPNFWPMSIVAKWLDDEDAAWYGSRPRSRSHCTRRGPSSREGGTAAPPYFRPMSIMATVAHLSYC